jgi:hypothetical protein
MFRILCAPSSGSTELCLTEITLSDSQIFCRVLGRCLAAYGPTGWELLYNYSVRTVRPAGNYYTTTVCVWSDRLGTTVLLQCAYGPAGWELL